MMRMDKEEIESIEQAQNQKDLTYSIHPGGKINYFSINEKRKPPIQLTSSGNLSITSSSSIPATQSSNKSSSSEAGELEKQKARRDAKKRRAEVKNVKNVIKIEHSETYDIDSVLKQLGENNSNKESSNGGNKLKKVKAERKRSGGKKKESKEESSATEGDDDDEEEQPREEEQQQQLLQPVADNQQQPEQLSVKSDTIDLRRQMSRSNEELFTPVKVKRKHKAAVKAPPIIIKAKDDSGHNYSSSSSASSTASSSAWATSRPAQKGYNLRRKAALQPSGSFDTMKSTASSVASERDLQEAKDQLDLSVDFPPLMSAGEAPAEPTSVITWVAKPISGNINNKACSDLTSSSSSSNSAVIDASDDQKPPPDVTVVRQKMMNQQCTTGLPDIAAQAPILANMTNSSGVSSNAGDLTPPHTTMSENEVLNCCDIDEDDKDIPAVVIMNNNNNQYNSSRKVVEEEVCEVVEFGFEVNVLDFLKAKNQLDHDDEAIVSFGQSLVHNHRNNNNNITTPESGIDTDLVNNNNNFYKVEDAVKIPHYAQVVQFVAKEWKKVERELRQGKAQNYYF